MRLLLKAIYIFLFSLGFTVHAQEISGEERIIVEALLDSAGTYGLKDPARTLQYFGHGWTDPEQAQYRARRTINGCATSSRRP